ncbi:hypothetical protein MKX03_000731 [Papaver bracteatum]|nr:hypothetical protein MKX03_000731 [Papaver bracteatum]
MLITTQTTNSPASDDELIVEINTQHDHEFMNISLTNHNRIEPKILSPRSSKNGTVIHGGGIGLVAALDNFGCTVDGEKTVTKLSSSTNRSNPIAILTINKYTKGCEGFGSVEMATSTTGGDGAATSVTRSAYCDGGIEDMRNQRLNKKEVGVFYESPSPVFYHTSAVTRDYPPSDFLSSCYLCRKKLHGKDIYMYRGEIPFCSTECRYQQIAADERKDKKRPRRRNSVSRSSYDDHIFSPGIMAI